MSSFLFFVTILCCVGFAIFTASQPSLSGDGAMGYGLGLAFFGLVFTLSSLALSIFMLRNGYFQWIANDGGARTAVVLLCWFFMALTTFFCAVFKWEWPQDGNLYPQFLRTIAVWHGQIWIPMLWLLACFLSLNRGTQMTAFPQAIKISFYAGILISGIYTVGLAIGYLRESAQAQAEEMASRRQEEDQWHQETMASIVAHKSSDPIIGLLIQTMQSQPADTRTAALAKVKEHPNWETEILGLLGDRRTYREVYYFLDGNAVTQPRQFAVALNESILWLAETIKADIVVSNNLQNWSFDMYQIGNMLRAIDGQFLNQGVDFVPNVVKLRQALDTTRPERFKEVRFDVTGVVEAWLAKQKK
jgi:hypothetical protein